MPRRKKNGFIISTASATVKVAKAQPITDHESILRSRDLSDVHDASIAKIMAKHQQRVERECAA
jgi:hypothetical protein